MRVVLMETAQKVIFNPKLRFVFIEIPKFRKRVHELRSGWNAGCIYWQILPV